MAEVAGLILDRDDYTLSDLPSFATGDVLTADNVRTTNALYGVAWRHHVEPGGMLRIDTDFTATRLSPAYAGDSGNVSYNFADGYPNGRTLVTSNQYDNARGTVSWTYANPESGTAREVVVFWFSPWPYGPGGQTDTDHYAWAIRLLSSGADTAPVATSTRAPVARLTGRTDGRGSLGSAPRLDTPSPACSSLSFRPGPPGSYDPNPGRGENL